MHEPRLQSRFLELRAQRFIQLHPCAVVPRTPRDAGRTALARDARQNLGGITAAHDEAAPALAQGSVERADGRDKERCAARRAAQRLIEFRVEYENRKHRARFRRRGQRCVILQAQVVREAADEH